MKRLYHEDMYRFGRPEPSLWEAQTPAVELAARELEGEQRTDVAIIGGGYTGLSAAFHLAGEHGIEACVLEAGHIGWGASGRNAGFCGIGATSLSLTQMLSRYGEAEARRFFQSQVAGIELVRELLEAEGIDAQVSGEAELEVAQSSRALEDLRAHANDQRRLFGIDNTVLGAEAFRERYFDVAGLAGGVVQRPAFALQPLRYLLGLARAAERKGARLHPRSEVTDWRKEGQEHLLLTRRGLLRARRVVVATNGFMPEHLHPAFYGRPLPMISAIVVTRPLTDEELGAHGWRTRNPAVTARRILDYYRLLPDRRLLFGGRGHSSGAAEGARLTFDRLRRRLVELWPKWRAVPIEYRWHGLICITWRLTPCVGRVEEDPTVHYAWGFHGNGVNTATWCGRELARWLAGGEGAGYPEALPAVYRGLSPRFPFPPLRLRYLQARLAMFRVQDALDR